MLIAEYEIQLFRGEEKALFVTDPHYGVGCYVGVLNRGDQRKPGGQYQPAEDFESQVG